MEAYRNGIFPMALEGGEIAWFSPDPRGVIPLDTFHVPHGLSNAMLLPEITAYSAPAALDRYADCARAMGVAEEGEGSQAAVARLLDALRSLNTDLKVPSPKDYGISKARYDELLPTMASQAIASGSPANNPRVPSQDEIIELYRRVYA